MAFTQIKETGSGLHIEGPIGFNGSAPVEQQTAGVSVKSREVRHDADAATNGTALLVAPIGGFFAFLNSTLAGNADSSFPMGEGGPSVHVDDNDSPAGVQIYFDEDAVAPDSRLLCVSPTGAALFVPSSDGRCLRIKHDASAATNGVALYFDDDAAPAAQLLFVSPTSTDGAFSTDDAVGLNSSALDEIRAALVALGLLG